MEGIRSVARSGVVQRRSDLPLLRKVAQNQRNILVTTARNIQEDHGGIDERVFVIQLRGEGAGRVPEDGVADRDRAFGAGAPREFVEFFGRE
jgi:hypothetical protein